MKSRTMCEIRFLLTLAGIISLSILMGVLPTLWATIGL